MTPKKLLVITSILANLVFIFILTSQVTDRSVDFSEVVQNETRHEQDTSQGTGSSQIIGEAANGAPQEDKIGETIPELAMVSKVIDGDTIVLDDGEVIRYIGIDSPEATRDCFAARSTAKNKQLVEGKVVRLEKDVSERDRYQRLLRYVYQDAIFVNDFLVSEGFATASPYPPDVKYQHLFQEAESEARISKRGLWGECNKEDVGQLEQVAPVLQEGDWECSSNTYNCNDFSTHAEAQGVYVACGGVARDIHKLDRDKDGVACETLP